MDNNLEREYINFEEKLGYHASRVISYPLIPPEHAYFSLTNRCNLRCKMCDISKNPSRVEDELTTDKAKDIILQVKNMGIKHLIFSGGEPLLRDDLLELAEFATQNNLAMVDIITNGTLFTDDAIQKLIKIKLNHITISLDGLGEVNDEIRGGGVFEKAKNAVDKLNYYKSKNNTFLPTVGINFTIMDKNIYDILPMVNFARDKKCNIIVFQPVLFSNTRMHKKRRNVLWPSGANIFKLKEIIKEVTNLKNMLGDLSIYTDTAVLEAFPNYFKGKRPGNTFKCYEAIKRIVITCDGKLWSCMGVYGNLKEQSLKEGWLSRKAVKIRNKVKKCREHCLQDCVYFPSDIAEDIEKFSKNLEHTIDGNKEKVKDRLLRKIEYYTTILSAESKPSSPNLIKNEINNLHSIKKDMLKIK